MTDIFTDEKDEEWISQKSDSIATGWFEELNRTGVIAQMDWSPSDVATMMSEAGYIDTMEFLAERAFEMVRSSPEKYMPESDYGDTDEQ